MKDLFFCVAIFIAVFAVLAGIAYLIPKPERLPDYSIVTVEGCQYIKNNRSLTTPLIHKGNCPNH